MSRWVVDASPLIFLAKLDHLLLLRSAAEDVLVPDSVLAEIRRYEEPATARIEQACERWLQPTPWTGDDPEPRVGELAVIGLALQKKADRVVMDDLAARRQARAAGLSVVGTLGLLLAARLRGELPSLSSEIDRLARLGFRVSRDLVVRVLAAAGEREP